MLNAGHTPRASIIVPAYNATATIVPTLDSLCAQTFPDYEVVVVDDGSTDETAAVVRAHGHPRIRLVRQQNRGLAGARNTGIANARGAFIGFCDADDLWRPSKLSAHVAHLEASPQVGLSYSGSLLIDENGQPLRIAQKPRLKNVTAAQIFRRNPVGNGSAAVLRRAALDDIAWRPLHETTRDWWFDENFRQSEDIECWLRLALTTGWQVEGVPGLLTLYRVAGNGLSAQTGRQYASWEQLVDKLSQRAPVFMARHLPAARAYQMRYLARRAVTSGNGADAMRYLGAMLKSSARPVWEEPLKTVTTLAAALGLAALGPNIVTVLRRLIARHM